MRAPVLTRLIALAAIAASAWTSAARAADAETHPAAPAFSVDAAALRPVFAAAGPPNLQLTIEVEFDSGGTVKVSRKLAKTTAAGMVRMAFSERRLLLSDDEGMPCRLDGTLISFFGGLLLASASGAAECGGSSSAIEGRLVAVSGIGGQLFPVQEGNALNFTTQAIGEMIDLFPSAAHQMKVAGMLSGVTLNATGASDVIYLFRHEEAPEGGAVPLVTDIYWSAALRWPIQMRMRTADGKAVFLERDLIRVAGVMPYMLPDGRTVPALDERTKGDHPLGEVDALARTFWRAARGDATSDVDATAQVLLKAVDPRLQPAGGLGPDFAPIASLVTHEEPAR
jgi:hypothetical protein